MLNGGDVSLSTDCLAQGQAGAEGLGSLITWGHPKSGSKCQAEHVLRAGGKNAPQVSVQMDGAPPSPQDHSSNLGDGQH